jgi:hypothetical protein
MPELPIPLFLSVLSVKLSIMISSLILQILTQASSTCQGRCNCLPSRPILPQPHHAHLLNLHALLPSVSRLQTPPYPHQQGSPQPRLPRAPRLRRARGGSPVPHRNKIIPERHLRRAGPQWRIRIRRHQRRRPRESTEAWDDEAALRG